MAKLGQYNLDSMTAQEALEASGLHLMEQSAKSNTFDSRGFESCVYNGDGVFCAAAIFIQGYDIGMENGTWELLTEECNQSSNHTGLVESLQVIHDSYEVKDWKEALKEVAKKYELDSAFLDEWSWNGELNKWVKGK